MSYCKKELTNKGGKNLKSVSIILPVCNGEKYLKNLKYSIIQQNYKGNIEFIVPVSKSDDNSYKVAKSLFDNCYEVQRFNHGRTRHEAALKAKGEILVFITQDIIPVNEYWLQSLVDGLDEDVVATYSRQIPYPFANPIEKLMREFNYPSYDRLCNYKTKDKWGRKNIYYSDSASATLKQVYLELDGYNFDCLTNEDVIYVNKVLEEKKSVLYNSNSMVYHSHNSTVKEIWKRYFLIGKFEAQNQYILTSYNTDGEGKKLVRYVLKNLLKNRDYYSLIKFIFLDCPTRLISYKLSYYKFK